MDRCLSHVRNLILTGQMLPGEKVQQAEIAAQLDMSRIPVREALTSLAAQGVLERRRNSGFTVARFTGEDLQELYLMRRLLETELLRSAALDEIDVDELARLNGSLLTLSPVDDADDYQETNRLFHFLVFDHSPMQLVRTEVARLWFLSDFYRAIYLFEVHSDLHVHEDHEQIIAAIRDRDVDELVRLSDAHRAATEELLLRRLGRSRPRSSASLTR